MTTVAELAEIVGADRLQQVNLAHDGHVLAFTLTKAPERPVAAPAPAELPGWQGTLPAAVARLLPLSDEERQARIVNPDAGERKLTRHEAEEFAKLRRYFEALEAGESP